MHRNFVVLFLIFTWNSFCQNDSILLTINGEEISSSEFLHVYNKNRDLIDESQLQTPSEYITLFIDYKLKVQEAIALGYAEKSTYKKDLKRYRNQLAQNFIKDSKVTDALVEEAYHRLNTEINARHILVRIDDENDTLKAYNKISNARDRIKSGENFVSVAKETSDDPSVINNGGELGWFKAFKMVYPFESAAYTTTINDISKPFRTKFGYHIVQPTAERPYKGTLEVAHIMIAHDQKDTAVVPSERIEELYKLLKKGSDFGQLAIQYSNDKSSANSGGKLPAFEQDQLVSKTFERQAFGIKNIAEYSKPFKTDFGWHIIKLIAKNPIPSFKEIQNELSKKVARDARSQIVDKTLLNKLRQRYNVKIDEEVLNYFKSIFKNENIDVLQEVDASKIAFKIVEDTYSYEDVFTYLSAKYRLKKININSLDYFIKEEIKRFVDISIKEYHLKNLEFIDSNFKTVLREYQEGLLLFDLLQEKVWNVASEDSDGLESFFQKNIGKYDSKDLSDVKGEVSRDYQQYLEKQLEDRLRAEAVIHINNEVLKAIELSNEN